MPSVDCWRLLGVSPNATAAEVKAGFAKRLRDVHPDGGGTGDGLTMSLLVDARDEALARIDGRYGAGSFGPGRSGGREWAGGGSIRERACDLCGQAFPAHQLIHEQAARGRSSRKQRVLVCLSCAAEVWDAREKRRLIGAALAILMAGGAVLLLLAVYVAKSA